MIIDMDKKRQERELLQRLLDARARYCGVYRLDCAVCIKSLTEQERASGLASCNSCEPVREVA